MTEIREPLMNYWYRALSSPHGIELRCSSFEAIRSRLYAARRETHDADLDQIAICRSPFDESRLWLIKKGSQDEKT